MSRPRLRPYTWPRWAWFSMGCCAAAAGIGVAIVIHSRPAHTGIIELPPDVTCRALLREPGFYAGRRVRLSTVGMQPGAHPTELTYRAFSALPPSLVVHCTHPVPVPTPPFVVGLVQVPDGGPVLVTECHPE